MSGFVVRPYAGTDEPGLRDLFRAVYGTGAEGRTSAWRYLAPAPWPAVIQVAETDSRIVGAQPSHAIDLSIDGDPVRGLLLLDVMTHPEYRRQGVFAGVVEGLRARAAAEGYRVLLTSPNRDAARSFARLAAWRRLGELAPWVRPCDARALLAGSSGWGALLAPLTVRRLQATLPPTPTGFPCREGLPDPGALLGFWREVAATSRCQIVRDARFLGWRFGDGSRRPYRLFSAGRAAALEAMTVTCTGRLLGRDIIFLADLMASRTDAGAAHDLLVTIIAEARRGRKAAVVGWFAPGSPAERFLRSSGFWRIPPAFRPRPYSVWGCTDLPGSAGTRALDLGSWHMTLADSDLA